MPSAADLRDALTAALSDVSPEPIYSKAASAVDLPADGVRINSARRCDSVVHLPVKEVAARQLHALGKLQLRINALGKQDTRHSPSLIDAAHGVRPTAAWTRAVNEHTRRQLASLGVTGLSLRVELREVAICAPRTTYTPDYLRLGGAFATLLVQLPMEHAGAASIAVRNPQIDEMVTHNFANTDSTSTLLYMGYCQAEAPSSGYRVFLRYEMCCTDGGPVPTLNDIGGVRWTMQRAAYLWASLRADKATGTDNHAPEKFCLLLRHQGELRFEDLWGADEAVVDTLRKSGEFSLRLALTSKGCGSQVDVSRWADLVGEERGDGFALSVSDDELLDCAHPPTMWSDRVLLVFWPRMDDARIACRTGVRYALDYAANADVATSHAITLHLLESMKDYVPDNTILAKLLDLCVENVDIQAAIRTLRLIASHNGTNEAMFRCLTFDAVLRCIGAFPWVKLRMPALNVLRVTNITYCHRIIRIARSLARCDATVPVAVEITRRAVNFIIDAPVTNVPGVYDEVLTELTVLLHSHPAFADAAKRFISCASTKIGPEHLDLLLRTLSRLYHENRTSRIIGWHCDIFAEALLANVAVDSPSFHGIGLRAMHWASARMSVLRLVLSAQAHQLQKPAMLAATLNVSPSTRGYACQLGRIVVMILLRGKNLADVPKDIVMSVIHMASIINELADERADLILAASRFSLNMLANAVVVAVGRHSLANPALQKLAAVSIPHVVCKSLVDRKSSFDELRLVWRALLSSPYEGDLAKRFVYAVEMHGDMKMLDALLGADMLQFAGKQWFGILHDVRFRRQMADVASRFRAEAPPASARSQSHLPASSSARTRLSAPASSQPRLPTPASSQAQTPKSVSSQTHHDDEVVVVSDSQSPPPPSQPSVDDDEVMFVSETKAADDDIIVVAQNIANPKRPRAKNDKLADPAAPVPPKKSPFAAHRRTKRRASAMDDEELSCEIVKKGRNTGVDLPHARHDCGKHVWKGPDANKELFCGNCFCYVCDVRAGECKDWSLHCQAFAGNSHWERHRQRAKRRRTT